MGSLELCHELLSKPFEWLTVSDLGKVCTVSHLWRVSGEDDHLWAFWYQRRFGQAPPQRRGGLTPGGAKRLYKYRWNAPVPGDRVEISWNGKFRLEGLNVFAGQSWWEGRVVESIPGYKYRVHYPGWDRRWDEWVPRTRLRWPVDKAQLSLDFTAKDIVEVWCTGTHVKGAWLQARVRKARGGYVALRNVLATSARSFWVPRDCCRRIVSPHEENKGCNTTAPASLDGSHHSSASRGGGRDWPPTPGGPWSPTGFSGCGYAGGVFLGGRSFLACVPWRRAGRRFGGGGGGGGGGRFFSPPKALGKIRRVLFGSG